MDESIKTKYGILLDGYILTALEIDVKFSDHINIVVVGPYKGCIAPMVDLNNYDFKIFSDKVILLH